MPGRVTRRHPVVGTAATVWHRWGVLRLAGARLLDDRDRAGVRTVLESDPVAACMVAARVEIAGLDPWRLGGELWAVGSRLDGLCFSGANLVPLRGERSAIRSFAERARRHGRTCSSLVGRAELVLPLWDDLAAHWAPAREVRADQPLMALVGPPAIAADPYVRAVRPSELDRYLPAAVAMFTEEVGIDPRAGDGGVGYRSRVAELVAAGRAFARFEGDEVVFKAEIGALSSQVGQIQGVWVHPERRGRGLGTAGTAAVVERLAAMGRVSSLYVNGFNHVARASYKRIGFTQVGSFATVLF
jgi:predicted GNAT family acetyltransferase